MSSYSELLARVRSDAEKRGHNEVARLTDELSTALASDHILPDDQVASAARTLGALYAAATEEDRRALEEAARRLAELTSPVEPSLLRLVAFPPTPSTPRSPRKIDADRVTVTGHGAVLVSGAESGGKGRNIVFRLLPWSVNDLAGKDIDFLIGAGGRLKMATGSPTIEYEFWGYLLKFLKGRTAEFVLFKGEAAPASRVVALSYRAREWHLNRTTLARHYPAGTDAAQIPDLDAEARELEAPFDTRELWNFHEVAKGGIFEHSGWRLVHLGPDKWRIFDQGTYLGDIDLADYPTRNTKPPQFMDDVINDPSQMRNRYEALYEGKPMVVPLGAGSGFTKEPASSFMFIDARGKVTIFDPNIQVMDSLARLGIPLGRVERVIVSHVHYDHVAGLWLLARYLPRRAELMIHANPGDEAEIRAGNAGHGEMSTLKAIVEMAEKASGGELTGKQLLDFFSVRPIEFGQDIQVGQYTMRFFLGNHSIPAIGLQIINPQMGLPVLLLTGDTRLDADKLRNAKIRDASGAEVPVMTPERAQMLASLVLATVLSNGAVLLDVGIPPLHSGLGYCTQLIGLLRALGYGSERISQMLADVRLYHAAESKVAAANFRYAGFGWKDAIPLADRLDWQEPRTGDVVAKMIRQAMLDVPVLSELRAADLEILAGMGTPETLSRGHLLIREGDPADDMFLLLDGAVSVTRLNGEGKSELLRTTTAGLLGEAVFTGQRVRNATVTALTGVTVLRLGANAIRFLTDIGVAARCIRLRELRDKIMTADGRVHILTHLDEITREALVLKARTVFMKAGDTVITEGGPPNGVFIVIDGELEVIARSGPLQQKPVVLGRGALVGEGTALGGLGGSATVRAKTNAQLLHAGHSDVQRLLEDRGDLRGHLVGLAQERGSIRLSPTTDAPDDGNPEGTDQEANVCGAAVGEVAAAATTVPLKPI